MILEYRTPSSTKASHKILKKKSPQLTVVHPHLSFHKYSIKKTRITLLQKMRCTKSTTNHFPIQHCCFSSPVGLLDTLLVAQNPYQPFFFDTKYTKIYLSSHPLSQTLKFSPFIKAQRLKAIREPTQQKDSWNIPSRCCLLETPCQFDLSVFKNSLSKISHLEIQITLKVPKKRLYIYFGSSSALSTSEPWLQ